MRGCYLAAGFLGSGKSGDKVYYAHMHERISLWRGMRPLIGTVVGVGFFGLPYVFARAGYGIALLELFLLAVVQIAFLRMYADLTLAKKGHARFLHIVADAFGPVGKGVAIMSFFGSFWGALVAYLLAGGEFLSYLLKVWIPTISPHVLSIGYGAVLFLALFGGMFVTSHVQKYLVPFFFCIIAFLVAFALPSVRVEYLASLQFDSWVLPLGVILFSLSAITAIPEMRDVLRGNAKRLHQAIFWGILTVATVYAIFTATVVGITGLGTPEQAISAFAHVAPWMVLVGSLLGLTTITSAYINVGSALINTLLYDFRARFVPSWLFVGGVPFVVVLLGVENMIHVLQFTGGVLGALLGIIVLLAYEKARRSRELSAHSHVASPFLVFGVFTVFFVMLVMTLRS
jgi:amino acid permease